ncbi:integrase arm-type DNA-binding domain-containing protein [Litorivicinus sp.]|nr:integrase arm-type DNA-binding domain-containing protein [Litorivicinus sp.]
MREKFTDIYVRNLSTPGRYSDSTVTGLNLQVKPNGKKYWTLRYTLGGKRRDLSLGSYPDTSLRQARIYATRCRADILSGRKPVAYWRHDSETCSTTDIEQQTDFQTFAKEVIQLKSSSWSNKKHAAQWSRTIETYANPIIGQLPLADITTDHIIKILKPIWGKKTVTATRVRQRIEHILSAAKVRGLRSGQNPAAWKGHLSHVLPEPTKIHAVKHYPALPYKTLPNFVTQLHESSCTSSLALEFLILTACRTSEVLLAKRSEISKEGIWIIPADRMKTHREHRVPLGKRAQLIVKYTKLIDSSEYLFSKNGKPLSNMALPMLMRRMQCQVTVHGFRSTFRDWVAEETEHSQEVAEMALAHAIKNKVEAAYRRGNLLQRRQRLMDDWELFCLSTSHQNATLKEG